MQAITALSKIGGLTARKMAKGENVLTMNVLRAADVLGYEILLVKRTDSQQLSENPDAVQKLMEYRQYQKMAKRTSRGYVDGMLPTRSKIKKPKTEHGFIMVQSRKEQIDKANSDDNFLRTE